MSRNGSGTYSLPSNSFSPAVAATTIDPTDWNSTASDLATAISQSICVDGQTTITGNLPMATFRHTGVGNGVAATDYAAMGQLQTNLTGWVVAGGTADAITAAYTPTVTALTDGMLLSFRASAANATATPTFKADGTTAHTITKHGGAALLLGDIQANLAEYFLRYNLANTRWELLNPNVCVVGSWTPTDNSGASLSFTSVSCGYTLNGNMCHVYGTLTYPVTASGSQAGIGGLPFTIANQSYADKLAYVVGTSTTGINNNIIASLQKNTKTVALSISNGASGGNAITNANLSTLTLYISFSYPVS